MMNLNRKTTSKKKTALKGIQPKRKAFSISNDFHNPCVSRILSGWPLILDATFLKIRRSTNVGAFPRNFFFAPNLFVDATSQALNLTIS